MKRREFITLLGGAAAWPLAARAAALPTHRPIRKAGMEATLQQFDALRSPGRTIRGHVDRLAPRMMAEMSSSENAAELQSDG